MNVFGVHGCWVRAAAKRNKMNKIRTTKRETWGQTKIRGEFLSTGIGLYGREPRSQIETSGSLSGNFYFFLSLLLTFENSTKKKQRQVSLTLLSIPLSNQNKIIIFAWLFSCALCSIACERDSERKLKKKTKNKLFLNICENCKWWRFSFIPIRIWRCCVVVHDCNRTIMITFQCL